MTDTTLFFRNGGEFTGTPQGGDKPFAMITRVCSRCGGAGGSDAWRFTGYTCYDCNGSGNGKREAVPLYTADKLARLDATLAKRNATKAAKLEAAAAAERAVVEARREAFQAEHAAVLAWLSAAGTDAQGEYREGFLGDMLARAHQRADWTVGQRDAVYASHAKAQAAKAVAATRRHVGAVGERIKLTVTVEREASYTRPSFGSYGDETVYITTLRDADGNALVVKSPRFREAIGSVLEIAATVKEHSEFRGEAQTVVQRVTVKAEEVAA